LKFIGYHFSYFHAFITANQFINPFVQSKISILTASKLYTFGFLFGFVIVVFCGLYLALLATTPFGWFFAYLFQVFVWEQYFHLWGCPSLSNSRVGLDWHFAVSNLLVVTFQQLLRSITNFHFWAVLVWALKYLWSYFVLQTVLIVFVQV